MLSLAFLLKPLPTFAPRFLNVVKKTFNSSDQKARDSSTSQTRSPKTPPNSLLSVAYF